MNGGLSINVCEVGQPPYPVLFIVAESSNHRMNADFCQQRGRTEKQSPSIHFLSALTLHLGSAGGWSLSQPITG